MSKPDQGPIPGSQAERDASTVIAGGVPGERPEDVGVDGAPTWATTEVDPVDGESWESFLIDPVDGEPWGSFLDDPEVGETEGDPEVGETEGDPEVGETEGDPEVGETEGDPEVGETEGDKAGERLDIRETFDNFIINSQEAMKLLWEKTKAGMEKAGRIATSKTAKKFGAFAGAFVAVKAMQLGYHEVESWDINVKAPDVDVLDWLANRSNDFKVLISMAVSHVNPFAVVYGAVSRGVADVEQNRIEKSEDPNRTGVVAPAISGAAAAFAPLSIENAASATAGFFAIDAVRGLSSIVSKRMPERKPKAEKTKGGKVSGKERRAALKASRQQNNNGNNAAVTHKPAADDENSTKLNLEGLI